jgi:hypothetical protein
LIILKYLTHDTSIEAMDAEVTDIKAPKAEYKRRLAEAVEWLQGEGHGEKP